MKKAIKLCSSCERFVDMVRLMGGMNYEATGTAGWTSTPPSFEPHACKVCKWFGFVDAEKRRGLDMHKPRATGMGERDEYYRDKYLKEMEETCPELAIAAVSKESREG